MRGKWDDSTPTRDIVMDAIYTEERAMWLDPEDLYDIVNDVMEALGKMRRIRR